MEFLDTVLLKYRLSGKLVGIGVYFSKSVQEELFVHYSPE